MEMSPILNVLKQIIRRQHKRLLEIGAGTGEHAIYLAPFFPHMEWTPTELPESLSPLARRVHESKIPNIRQPHSFEVGQDDFPIQTYDVVFTANTFHIMSWKECKTLIKLLSIRLSEGGKVVIYGPFNYNSQLTSPFRAFEDVNKAMLKHGFELVQDYEMPDSNHMLVYSRLKFVSKR